MISLAQLRQHRWHLVNVNGSDTSTVEYSNSCQTASAGLQYNKRTATSNTTNMQHPDRMLCVRACSSFMQLDDHWCDNQI
jgi:hypothetical protein